MAHGVVIRDLEEEDLSFFERSEEEGGLYEPERFRANFDAFRDSRKAGINLVAVVDGVPAGCMLVRHYGEPPGSDHFRPKGDEQNILPPHFILFKDLEVQKYRRGRGVARALLEAAHDKVLLRGVDYVVLAVTHSDTQRPDVDGEARRRLYEGASYERLGVFTAGEGNEPPRRLFEYSAEGNDYHLYAKKLDGAFGPISSVLREAFPYIDLSDEQKDSVIEDVLRIPWTGISDPGGDLGGLGRFARLIGFGFGLIPFEKGLDLYVPPTLFRSIRHLPSRPLPSRSFSPKIVPLKGKKGTLALRVGNQRDYAFLREHLFYLHACSPGEDMMRNFHRAVDVRIGLLELREQWYWQKVDFSSPLANGEWHRRLCGDFSSPLTDELVRKLVKAHHLLQANQQWTYGNTLVQFHADGLWHEQGIAPETSRITRKIIEHSWGRRNTAASVHPPKPHLLLHAQAENNQILLRYASAPEEKISLNPSELSFLLATRWHSMTIALHNQPKDALSADFLEEVAALSMPWGRSPIQVVTARADSDGPKKTPAAPLFPPRPPLPPGENPATSWKR